MNFDNRENRRLTNPASRRFQFTRRCGDSHIIDRTDPRCSQRVYENIPKCLINMMTQNFLDNHRNRNSGSLQTKHGIGNMHKVDPVLPSKPLLRNRGSKQLAFSEASGYAILHHFFEKVRAKVIDAINLSVMELTLFSWLAFSEILRLIKMSAHQIISH